MIKATKHEYKLFSKYISLLNLGVVNDQYEYEYFFRGCADIDWKYNLIPGIYRGDGKINEEHIFFRELILRSPQDFLNEKSTLEKLVKMQHYALPTRLLDITSNPLVALYFACQNYKKNDDGVVYVFKIRKNEIKYYDSDSVSLISNLAKLNIEKSDFTDSGCFDYLMHEIRDEKPHFRSDLPQELNENDLTKVFPVKVKLNNNRIVSQSGAFFIFGIENLTSKLKPASLSSPIIDKQIIIPNKSKAGLIEILEKLAINETTLFPELEHQAKYLIR